jgi:DNA-binding MarR family transcriptional regulator
MDNGTLTRVIDDLVSLPPLIHRSIRRNLFKKPLSSMDAGISPLHVEIMKMLERSGTMHLAEIGGTLRIPKSQMTRLMDRLVNLGMVERQTDAADRRIVNVALTNKGRDTLEEIDQLIRDSMRANLSCLTNEELEELSVLLRRLRAIFSRLL